MRSLGNEYSPLSFDTTVLVMVEPSFLMLTRTPSMTGSWVEDTFPVRICACAAGAAISAAPRLTLASSQTSMSRIVTSQNDCRTLCHSRRLSDNVWQVAETL